MKEKRKGPATGIKKYLEENKAENDALKKLIVALQNEELKKKNAGKVSENHHN